MKRTLPYVLAQTLQVESIGSDISLQAGCKLIPLAGRLPRVGQWSICPLYDDWPTPEVSDWA